MVRGIESRMEMTILNGDREHRYPGNLNYSFAYVEGESMLMVSLLVPVTQLTDILCGWWLLSIVFEEHRCFFGVRLYLSVA